MAPRPFRPTPAQQALLDELAAAAAALAETERRHREIEAPLRARRDQALQAAVASDITVVAAAAAANLSRQNAHAALTKTRPSQPLQ